MTDELAPLDVVRLAVDRPDDGLHEGQRGTIVEAFEKPRRAYEVEFLDSDGYTTAVITALPGELQLVHSHGRT